MSEYEVGFLPCPFCGKKDGLVVEPEDDDWTAWCERCAVGMYRRSSRAELKRDWNTRFNIEPKKAPAKKSATKRK